MFIAATMPQYSGNQSVHAGTSSGTTNQRILIIKLIRLTGKIKFKYEQKIINQGNLTLIHNNLEASFANIIICFESYKEIMTC